MLNMGLGLAAVLIPAQIVFGHLTGEYTAKYQPSKFTAIEGRWQTEQPARLLPLAWPDVENERNALEVAVPYLGSFVDTGSFTSRGARHRHRPEGAAAAVPDPVLFVPHHGRDRPADAGDVVGRHVASGRGWDRTPRAFLWMTFLRLPAGLHRRARRLVHCRSWPAAVGGVRTAEDGGRGDAEPRCRRSVDIADRVRHRLYTDLLSRHLLHLSPAEGGARCVAAEAEAGFARSGRCRRRGNPPRRPPAGAVAEGPPSQAIHFDHLPRSGR